MQMNCQHNFGTQILANLFKNKNEKGKDKSKFEEEKFS
jgi:hypothetical protein